MKQLNIEQLNKEFREFVKREHWSTRCEPYLIEAPKVEGFLLSKVSQILDEMIGEERGIDLPEGHSNLNDKEELYWAGHRQKRHELKTYKERFFPRNEGQRSKS